MMRRVSIGLSLTVVLFGVVLFYQSAAISTRGGEDAPLYSIHRYDPSGAAAIHELLAKRGVPVRALQRPELEPGDKGVLIQILPHQTRLSGPAGRTGPSATQLLAWATEGNTILQFTREPTALMDKLKLAFAGDTPAELLEELTKAERRGKGPDEVQFSTTAADWSMAGDMTRPNDLPIVLQVPSLLKVDPDSNCRPLARERGNGGIVAGEYRVGKGRLIIVGATNPILNGDIGTQGNLGFVLALIGEQPVIFDEWSHGVGHQATIMSFVRSAGLLPVLLQLLFLMAIYVWSTSGHAQLDSPPRKRQRSSIEQIETLGYLYYRSLTPELAFERVYRETQRRVAEALRCQPQQIPAHLPALSPEARRRYDQLVARLNGVGRGHGPRCGTCGYDLTLNASGQCPECGGIINPEMRMRIGESAPMTDLQERRPGRRIRIDSDLAAILTLSHQLVQEIERDRHARK